MKKFTPRKKSSLIYSSHLLSRYAKYPVLALSLIAVCFISTGFGQNCPQGKTASCVDNGIDVRQPKIFDNRSLVIMLEELNRQLQAVKVVDQKSLLDSLGLSQGSQSSEVSRAFEFGVSPLPAVKTTRKPDADGNLTVSEEATDQKEFSAKPPGVPDSLSAPKYEPKFGTSAEDLLTQQIDLTYKIFNLRMLLERSISDRLTTDAGTNYVVTPDTGFTNTAGFLTISAPNHGLATGTKGRFMTSGVLPGSILPSTDYYIIKVNDNSYKLARTYDDAMYGNALPFTDNGSGKHTFMSRIRTNGSRVQAVVGFDLSLNPPKDKRDMAAFVELTVTTDENKPVSVVALMPQEKTYNTSALSTKSNAFGGSAVFKIFSLGYSERRRGQTFYLYQDADTITYGKRPSDIEEGGNLSEESPTFGWQFRPVLNRPSVSSGTRQVFAVLSIDKRDLVNISESTKLNFKVRTYWKKFSHKTSTVYDEDRNPFSFVYKNIHVFSTSKYQAGLGPIIDNAKWNQLDDKNGVLTIEGENFFTGTNVLVGNTVSDNPANGLTLKSEQSLQVRTTLDAFANGEVVVNGRYGNSEAVIAKPIRDGVPGFMIEKLSSRPLSDKTTRIIFTLRNKATEGDNKTLESSNYSKNILANPLEGHLEVRDIEGQGVPPIVVINNTSFLLKNPLQSVRCAPIVFNEWFNQSVLIGKTPDQQKIIKESHKIPYNKNCVMAQIDVPTALVKEDVPITFKVPLLGPGWRSTLLVYYDSIPSSLKLSKIGSANKQNYFSITGNNLNELRLMPPSIGKIKFTYTDNSLFTFQLTDTDLKSINNVFLKVGNQQVILAIPSSTPPAESPKITVADPAQIYVNSSKTVTFKGEALGGIKQATFEGKNLQIVKSGAKEIVVLLTREVTKAPGEVEIIFRGGETTLTGKVVILETGKEIK